MYATHPIPSTGASQCALILEHLQRFPGQWCSMPMLATVSGSYAVATRVSELRKQGHVIEQKNEREGNKIKSFYRIVEGGN